MHCIAQAKLTKNYGILRMDPYCRVRLANVVLESRVSPSGGKNPVWNDILSAYVRALVPRTNCLSSAPVAYQCHITQCPVPVASASLHLRCLAQCYSCEKLKYETNSRYPSFSTQCAPAWRRFTSCRALWRGASRVLYFSCATIAHFWWPFCLCVPSSHVLAQGTFSADERIAWAHIIIPQEVLNGRTSDQWYDLNGKQGDGKEGAINIILKLEQQVCLSFVHLNTDSVRLRIAI